MNPRTPIVAAAILLLAAAALPQPGSAQGVSGRWHASVPTRVQNVNGVETASDTAVIEITLEQRGDSVFGTTRLLGGPVPERPPRQLRGAITAGTLQLDADPVEAIIRTDAGESRIQMTTTYLLKVEGEWLTGTQQSTSADGSVQSEARPFRARKAG